MGKVPPFCWLGLGIVMSCGEDLSRDTVMNDLRAAIAQRVSRLDAEVSVYYRTLDGTEMLTFQPDIRMHAASTMKVPVMLQLYRDAADGRIDLDAPVPVRTRFASIVDGSSYDIDPSSDSDQLLYERVGETVPRRELIDRMITRSSNLATNLLIADVGASRVTVLCRSLGADSIEVLRGVEDLKAFEAGLSNTTTARDLGIIMTALATGRAADSAGTAEMLAILSRQHFNEGIPAGLPAGVRVAHKTGWITGIDHDAAIVYPPDAAPFVLVIMVRGVEDHDKASALIAELARLVYTAAVT